MRSSTHPPAMIGLGIPLLDKDLKDTTVTLPAQASNLRWPYRSISASAGAAGGYDSSSSSPSSPSSSSSSDSEQATNDFILSYFSPTPVAETGQKVYLLSSGPRTAVKDHRRVKSETFRFPRPPPPTKFGLKSALRKTSKDYSTFSAPVSPPCRASKSLGYGWNPRSPILEEEQEARQGWSPYSSAAPTPRQVSYSNTEDKAKLARLHASLYLLDSGVEELPLSLGEEGGEGESVEERMAFLCGLGYRPGNIQEMKRAVSGASTVPSICASPILFGELGAASEVGDDEGDDTIRPTERIERELGDEFGYLLNDALWECEVDKIEVEESGLMTPPLTTPELGMEDDELEGLIEAWPSPMTQRLAGVDETLVEGCRPYPLAKTAAKQSHVPEANAGMSESSILSNLPTSASASVLSRPRPISRSTTDLHSFVSKSQPIAPPRAKMPKSASTTVIPTQRHSRVQFKIPQRKSSLDIRAQAQLAAMAEKPIVHPNSVCKDAEVEARLYSSASAYIGLGKQGVPSSTEGGMTKSFSMPALYHNDKKDPKKKGRNGKANGLSMEVFSQSAIGLAL